MLHHVIIIMSSMKIIILLSLCLINRPCLNTIFRIEVSKSFNSISEKLKLTLFELFKGVLPGLSQVLATERPLIMMKNAFYITLKDFFVL